MSVVGPLVLLVSVGWVIVTLLTVAAATFAVLAWRRPTTATTAATVGLTVVALLVAALLPVPSPGFVALLVTVAALVLSVAGGSAVTRAVLDRVAFDEAEGAHGGLVAADGRERLRGGAVIGLLERVAVTGAIVAGFPEALAVVIAIKGVGRFSELETGAVRERFIVGTLTSWVWAASAAGIVLLVRT
ncbi:MAG: hypothetical protein QOC55_2454 [Thermoleophilaceae bacterium]|nr:hypothetical protein [Thermoleophilaceae bacterium]